MKIYHASYPPIQLWRTGRLNSWCGKTASGLLQAARRAKNQIRATIWFRVFDRELGKYSKPVWLNAYRLRPLQTGDGLRSTVETCSVISEFKPPLVIINPLSRAIRVADSHDNLKSHGFRSRNTYQ